MDERSAPMKRNSRWLFLAALTLGSSSLRANAQVISNSPNLPPANGVYVSPAQAHQIYVGPGLSIDVFNIRHFGFSLSTPPPLLIGGSTVDTFGSVLTGMISDTETRRPKASSPATSLQFTMRSAIVAGSSKAEYLCARTGDNSKGFLDGEAQ